ncbi:helix-turn-helix domain-containing protein [Solihabitans fulvus]|uniref:Helix-turn-helix domain-containing protein n=1 Tax=Solihabitans fulvus TaxID=1892852 RepID=A0A5B2W7R0_9PSEU|nr:helix-turn-helix transcriptional regulator [Solihabitans fulvus]KAA2247305.1 helix-turn-helix domain-containing protein [Solihabitans fulvus]
MARPDPTLQRQRIGKKLRAFRSSAPERVGRKFTAADAAAVLGCTQPKISQMEAGKYRLQWRDVRDLLTAYGASGHDIDRLVEAAALTAQPTWWAPYRAVVGEGFAELVGGEGEALTEITYEHGVMPGLVQTQPYAEALTVASRAVSATNRELVVGLRMERQRRLTEDDPLELVALIEESVLHRPIGTPEIMTAQLDHLLTLGQRPNVTIQIVPTAAGAHAALAGRFVLLLFAEFSPAVYLEHPPPLGARWSDDPLLSTAYEEIAAAARQQALSPEDSAAVIRTTLDDLV